MIVSLGGRARLAARWRGRRRHRGPGRPAHHQRHSEVSVTTTQVRNEPIESGTGPVDLDALVCPGCGDPVAGEPPLGWPAGAGETPGFSHTDGSVLCPDSAGRIGEPVESGGLRFALTDAGSDALSADAGAIADRAGVRS